MPTYEYRCPEGHQFDRFFRKMSDAVAELPCPECGKIATKQLSGGAGLVFKGSGFYLTDYGKNAHRKSGEDTSKNAKSESRESSDAKSGESKSNESKSTSDKPAADSSSSNKGSTGSSDAGGSKSSKADD